MQRRRGEEVIDPNSFRAPTGNSRGGGSVVVRSNGGCGNQAKTIRRKPTAEIQSDADVVVVAAAAAAAVVVVVDVFLVVVDVAAVFDVCLMVHPPPAPLNCAPLMLNDEEGRGEGKEEEEEMRQNNYPRRSIIITGGGGTGRDGSRTVVQSVGWLRQSQVVRAKPSHFRVRSSFYAFS